MLPAAEPVTKPVLLTLATVLLVLLHVPAADVSVSVVLVPAHIAFAPLIAPGYVPLTGIVAVLKHPANE